MQRILSSSDFQFINSLFLLEISKRKEFFDSIKICRLLDFIAISNLVRWAGYQLNGLLSMIFKCQYQQKFLEKGVLRPSIDPRLIFFKSINTKHFKIFLSRFLSSKNILILTCRMKLYLKCMISKTKAQLTSDQTG